MPWPPRILERDEIAQDQLEFWDDVDRRQTKFYPDWREKGSKENPGAYYYRRLLHSPELAAHLCDMGRVVRGIGERGDSYTHLDREWVDMVLAVDLKTNVTMLTHTPAALAVGMRLEAIAAIRAGREEDLTDDERQLTDYIRRVVNGKVTREAWEAMERRMGERGVVEYTIFILYLFLIMRLEPAVGVEEMSDAEVDQMLKEYRDGTRIVPKFRTGELTVGSGRIG